MFDRYHLRKTKNDLRQQVINSLDNWLLKSYHECPLKIKYGGIVLNKRRRKKQLQKLRQKDAQSVNLFTVSTEELWEELAARLVSISSGGHTFFVDVTKNWPCMTIYNTADFSLVTKRRFGGE
jgi:hypothetical protein